ncbi:MAG: metallopeptidase, partial [Oscillospiraceae bacterium]|nr:metallopeptidase [Oscillospiraceae bacterium]
DLYMRQHTIWYLTGIQKAGHGIPGYRPTSSDNEESEDGGEQRDTVELAEDWSGVAERMQVDMESFGRQRGIEAGLLTQNLREVNRERYDYTEFLKKFAVRGEVMKINPDEFDYNFYTYGLELYEDMPLIEPLEYKEVKRIREFVIAIDTSGSVSGELVQAFVQKTFNILKSTESFFSKINIHIIQCDAAIQEDVKITTQKEFDDYLRTMRIQGLGGTDFRPVFSYVNSLVEIKEFENLKGLIYFTDGYGEFPSRKPPYETAFVFVDEGDSAPAVPPWAIKLVLRRNEI